MSKEDEILNDEDLDETLYEQSKEELDKAYRTSRGDFIVDEDEDQDSDDEEDLDDEEDEEESSDEEESDEDGESEEDEDGENEESEGEEEGNDEDEEESPRIPRSRLNQVIEQREEYKDRVAWLEEQLERLISNPTAAKKEEKEEVETRPEYDFDKAEAKYIELILDGETDKAISLRKEINEERSYLFKSEIDKIKEEAAEIASTNSDSAVKESKFDTLVESYENKYPFLNADSDEYNEDAVETVNTLMVGYMQNNGLDKAEALTKAINKASPMFSKETKTTLGNKKKSRSDTSKKKALDAAKKQPKKPEASLKDTKTSVTDIPVSKLSEGQFKKLTAKEKAILRGDVVG